MSFFRVGGEDSDVSVGIADGGSGGEIVCWIGFDFGAAPALPVFAGEDADVFG